MSYPIILHSIHEDANIQQKHGGTKRRRETRHDLPYFPKAAPRHKRSKVHEVAARTRSTSEFWVTVTTWNSTQPKVGWWFKIESERKWEYLSIIGSELPKRGLPTNSPGKIWSNRVSKLPKTHNFMYPFSHNHQGLGDTPIFQPWCLQVLKSDKKSALPKSDTKVLNLLPKVSP